MSPNAPSGTSDGDDKHLRLKTLLSEATRAYSLKQYSVAAESYSLAAELQDELSGEMAPENADVLYQYGRCLYHVAVANSDVLGGKVAGGGEDGPKRKKRKVVKDEGESSKGGGGLIGDALKGGDEKGKADEDDSDSAPITTAVAGSKPFFQITGDENWTDSEEEEEDADADPAAAHDAQQAAEEEEDDFAIAYEILDTARILLTRQLTTLQKTDTTLAADKTQARQIKERLADTHDLQAEISLENERFADAVNDTRDALTLKLELYPQESSLVAEAHFKLSLALEFASATPTGGKGADGEGRAETTGSAVDESMRAQAAAEMEKAIASCSLRIEKEEASLASLGPKEVGERKSSIEDVREMVGEMKQRLTDLRNPAVLLSGPATAAGAGGAEEAMQGMLGAIFGGQAGGSHQAKAMEALAGKANDLTAAGMVRRKKGKAEPAPAPGNGGSDATAGEVVGGKGKRKAEDTGAAAAAGGSGSAVGGKKVKFEDGGVE